MATHCTPNFHTYFSSMKGPGPLFKQPWMPFSQRFFFLVSSNEIAQEKNKSTWKPTKQTKQRNQKLFWHLTTRIYFIYMYVQRFWETTINLLAELIQHIQRSKHIKCVIWSESSNICGVFIPNILILFSTIELPT